MWILIFGAMSLILQTFKSDYHQRISIFNLIPVFIKAILLSFLALDIPVEFITRKNSSTQLHKRVWKIGIYFILLLIYVDRIGFAFFSRCLDMAALDSNPGPLLDSMIYMLVKSHKIWINGIVGTLEVSLLGTMIGFLCAILLVFLRINTPSRRNREIVQLLKLIGNTFEKIYVTVIRGTPMMVQACIVYYAGFTIVKAYMTGASITEVNQAWSFFTAGLITVSLNTAAYLAEALRGGIESLDKGQREAAESLGFTNWQTMMKVIFPQAVRNSMPAIGNEFINNIKGTSVLNIIGFVELMFATGTVAGFYYKYLASYCIAAIIYLIITFSLTWLLNYVAKKIGITQLKMQERNS